MESFVRALTGQDQGGSLALQRGKREVGSWRGTAGRLQLFACPRKTGWAPDTVQAVVKQHSIQQVHIAGECV